MRYAKKLGRVIARLHVRIPGRVDVIAVPVTEEMRALLGAVAQGTGRTISATCRRALAVSYDCRGEELDDALRFDPDVRLGDSLSSAVRKRILDGLEKEHHRKPQQVVVRSYNRPIYRVSNKSED